MSMLVTPTVTCTFVVSMLVLSPNAKVADQPPRTLTCAVEIAPSDSGSGRVGFVAVGPAGRLAWTDGRPGQVLVRDSRRRVRAIGRTGSGPGEFRTISRAGWWGDTLWVGDFTLPRVQFFNDTGAYLRAVTAMTPASWAPRPGGTLVGFARRRLASDLPEAVLRQRAKEGIDSIANWPRVPGPRVQFPSSPPTGNEQPFAAQLVVGASPDHSRFCGARPDGNAWQLECIDDEARVQNRTRLSLTGHPLTDDLFDSTVVLFSRNADKSETRKKMLRPRALPAINGIMVADNGDVWLERSHRFERTAVWQRVTRTGLESREIAIAPLTRLLLVRGDSVWGAQADADGLESLLRCALPKP